MPHATDVLPNAWGVWVGRTGWALVVVEWEPAWGAAVHSCLSRIIADRCSASARAAAMKAGGGIRSVKKRFSKRSVISNKTK